MSKINRFIAGSVFVMVLLLGAGAVSAQAASLTASQIDAIIGLLQSFGADSTMVANVRSVLSGGGVTTQPWCHTFNTNMGVGATGAEVQALETALMREGYQPPQTTGIAPIYNSVYNEAIASAVVKFQAKYGILQTGYVGPLTRAQLNKLYGCGDNKPPIVACTYTPPPTGCTYVPGPNYTVGGCGLVLDCPTKTSITVTYPNGGETLYRDRVAQINWTSNLRVDATTQNTGPFDIYLVPQYNVTPCDKYTTVCPMYYPYKATYTIAKNVLNATGSKNSYSWLVGKVQKDVNTDMMVYPTDGQYFVKVCQSGTNVCDQSDSYFTIRTVMATQ